MHRVGAAVGLAYLQAGCVRRLVVIFCAMVVMVTAVVFIAAKVVMYLFACFAGKQREHLHGMVQRAFVEPEPHKRRHIDQQQKCRREFACEFHVYLTIVTNGMRANTSP